MIFVFILNTRIETSIWICEKRNVERIESFIKEYLSSTEIIGERKRGRREIYNFWFVMTCEIGNQCDASVEGKKERDVAETPLPSPTKTTSTSKAANQIASFTCLNIQYTEESINHWRIENWWYVCASMWAHIVSTWNIPFSKIWWKPPKRCSKKYVCIGTTCDD